MWYDVKKVLPPVNQKVIVYTKNNKVAITNLYIPRDCKGNILGNPEWKGSSAFKNSIIAWMDIPECNIK